MQPHKKISLASTNSTLIKSGNSVLGAIIAINLTSTVKYVKIYDKATSPTIGTDTPILTLPIPANTAGAGFVLPVAVMTNLGIGYGITGAASDNDTTAVGAGEVVVNFLYE